MAEIQLAQLLDAGVHFGHKARRWNPKMFPYIYAERDGVHIIDLIQTLHYLKQARTFLENISREEQTYLFVGTKRQATSVIAFEAQRCGGHYVNERWLGGLLTNWANLKTRIDRLKFLEDQESQNLLDDGPKRDSAKLKKELERLRKYFTGVKQMTKRPDVIIVVDPKREMTAIREAIKLKIPIISILDTNCDPDFITMPIPGNDDSIGSIKLIVHALVDSICNTKEN